MSVLQIREYTELARGREGGAIEAGKEPGHVDQVFTISGSSAPSAAFAKTTKLVRIHTDVACNIKFGSAPTALKQSAGGAGGMEAGQTEHFGVVGGQKVAAITEG